MTARLLLDTCAIIWITTREPLGSAAREAMALAFAANERVGISPISAWELGLLGSKDLVATSRSATSMFSEMLATPGIKIEPLSHDILIESSFLPGTLHRDPADRILVATARMLNLILVTRDRAILDYAEQGYVRVLAC